VKLDKAETYDGLSGAVGGDGVSGFVTIQRGCDKFCTFCVVPFTRGRERGTAPREVLRQVRELADAGYREVVLLGQTVNSYRWDDVTFAELLRAVARVDGIARVRFTSPYPVDFTDDVIAAIAEEPALCKYVHLPVQSGAGPVLERMRRGYTVDGYRAIVAALRRAMPEIALSTDLLTGFSGETEDDHRATLDLMRELRFDSAFMFAYSERDLTFAARKLPDDVPPAVKQRRLAEIVALQERISAEVFAAHVGRRERVLIHGPSKRDPAVARRGLRLRGEDGADPGEEEGPHGGHSEQRRLAAGQNLRPAVARFSTFQVQLCHYRGRSSEGNWPGHAHLSFPQFTFLPIYSFLATTVSASLLFTAISLTALQRRLNANPEARWTLGPSS